MGALMDDMEDISDDELDLLDEIEEESNNSSQQKQPKPASVMEVDWSLLSNINNKPSTAGKPTLHFAFQFRLYAK